MKRKHIYLLATLGLFLTAASAFADEYKNVVVIPDSAKEIEEQPNAKVGRKIATISGVTLTTISTMSSIYQIDDTVNNVVCYTKSDAISCVKK